MARQRPEGAPEPKRRSRFGCWPCKARKIKCGEEKPSCTNCEKQGEQCDYSIKLNWEVKGPKKNHERSSPTPNTSTPGLSREATQTIQFDKRSPAAASQILPTSSPRQARNPTFHSSSNPPSRRLSRSPRSTPYDTPSSIQTHVSPYEQLRDPPFTAEYSIIDPDLETRIKKEPSILRDESSLPLHLHSQSPKDRSGSNELEINHRRKRIKHSPTRVRSDGEFANPFDVSRSDPRPGAYPTGQKIGSFPSPGVHANLPPSPYSPAPSLSKPLLHNRNSVKRRSSDDTRRLSIKSLLSKSDDIDGGSENGPSLPTLGFDQGRADLDLPKNDDTNALTAYSPSSTLRQLDSQRFPSPSYAGSSNGFGFGLQAKDPNFDGYYSEPVPIQISRSLEPLPDLLTENPMNLLYFHHFLNHTARILVPHDCPDNPFRSILPQLAVRNVNLLNLLLAYSASHRARLLNYPEPVNRIAIWVCEVFPTLRLALADTREQISDSNLATAIMLASLEIISPNAFEYPISWQNHLTIAREMIIARGGYQSLSREDRVSYFLSRWFTYLDVLGSLSGGTYDRPLGGTLGTVGEQTDADCDLEIDCFLGFTTFCIRILASVADLAKQCDSQRVLPNGDIDAAWQPPAKIANEAERLRVKLEAPRPLVYRGCSHQPNVTSNFNDGRRDSTLADYSEMVATNEAFHQAGLIHLHRRVLNKPSTAPEVQEAVHAVVEALRRISEGGTAEACMIFPMFSAGCEARDSEQQQAVLHRMVSVENLGMAQGRKARLLMQKVWETGRPWETLVTGEFFG